MRDKVEVVRMVCYGKGNLMLDDACLLFKPLPAVLRFNGTRSNVTAANLGDCGSNRYQGPRNILLHVVAK